MHLAINQGQRPYVSWILGPTSFTISYLDLPTYQGNFEAYSTLDRGRLWVVALVLVVGHGQLEGTEAPIHMDRFFPSPKVPGY